MSHPRFSGRSDSRYLAGIIPHRLRGLSFYLRWVLVLVSTILPLLIPSYALAQTQIATGARGVPFIDSSGNAFYSTTSAIFRIPYSNGSYQAPVQLFTGSARYLAGDSAGNLYLAGATTDVQKATLTNGTYVLTTILANQSNVAGIGVDSAGGVYLLNGTQIRRGTDSGSGTYTFTQIATAPTGAASMGVDPDGNIYLPAPSSNQILKYTATAGYSQSTIYSGTLNQPQSVTVDQQGTLYISDYINRRVLKAIPESSGYSARVFEKFPSITTTQLAVNAGGTSLVMWNMSFGGVGNLIAYPTSSQDRTVLDFASVAVGSSVTRTATVSISTAGTLSNTSVSLSGSPTQEYTDVGGGTCQSGTSYTSGTTCTVQLRFNPSYAGLRPGAVSLSDSAGNVLGSTFLTGIGTGPQIAITNYQRKFIGTQFTSAITPLTGIAVDGAGTLYASDLANKRVMKYVPNGAGTYDESIAIGGLLGPRGVAVDAQGNLFVSDRDESIIASNSGFLLKLLPTAGGTYTQTTLLTGLNFPQAVTTDSSGNIYVGQQFNNGNSGGFVTKLTLLPSGAYTPSRIVEYLPAALAVDAAGNLYIGQSGGGGTGVVIKATQTPEGDYTTASLNASTWGALALDGSGNLYTTTAESGGGSNIKRSYIASDGTTTGDLVSVTANFSGQSVYVAVDAAGNVYTTGTSAILQNGSGTGATYNRYPIAQTPVTNLTQPVDFGTSPLGTVAFPTRLFVVANIGNDTLSLTPPSSGTNASISPTDFYRDTSVTSGVCTPGTPGAAAITLNAGATCRYWLAFRPTRGGQITGSMVFTDNDRNINNATQSVPLLGTGQGGTANSLSVAVPNVTITAGTANAPLAATVTFNNSAPTGAVAFSVRGSAGAIPGVCTAGSGALSCTANFPSGSLTTGIYTITASIAGDNNYSAGSSSGLLTVTAPAQQPAATLTPTTSAFGSQNVGTTSAARAFTLTNTGNVPLAITSISTAGTNASAFRISTNSCGTTLAQSASCQISVTFSPTSAGSATATLTAVDSAGTQSAPLSGTGVTTATAADFTVAVTPSQQSVLRGSSVSYTVQLASVDSNNPFTGIATLSASGLGSGMTATFSPTSLVPGAGQAATSTLTITVPVLVANDDTSRSLTPHIAMTSLACVLLFWPLRRRGKLVTRLLLLILSVVCSELISGCGGGTGFAPPPSTATITVTATSGSITHTSTATLNVR